VKAGRTRVESSSEIKKWVDVMNLVTFSMKTKGMHNFARRLWTVFTRFGVSETKTKRALQTVIDSLQPYHAAPTFYIPAVVLGRHPALISEMARRGAEIGIHGYVHNDYRTLSKHEQLRQTKQAISVFERTRIPYRGFRNPYLGWTEDTLDVFTGLGFTYESNEAVIHDAIDLGRFPPHLRSGFEKSLQLFQAIPCSAYALRPHFEGPLLRIPTSIPDDEMVFDRLRITDATEVGAIWSRIMQRVYDFGGLYVLNLHPERATLCKRALEELLAFASSRPLPVWKACLRDIARWWKERSRFRLDIVQLAPDRWRVQATCTPRATLLARHLTVEDQPTTGWSGPDVRVQASCCTVQAVQCPCIGLSPRTSQQVLDFLLEQGYPAVRCSGEEAGSYASYLDLPEGWGATRQEQFQRRSALVQRIEGLQSPLLHFACWPDGSRAALAISGDIDSVTVQDFFLRVLEVQ
jgi:peptidoglycan/xylan/chitin deacetylase (PgdA/CDA1 family)